MASVINNNLRRTALIAVCVLAIAGICYFCISMLSFPVHNSEVTIAKRIAELKGAYTVDSDSGRHIVAVNLSDSQVTDVDLQSLQSLKLLKDLRLDRTRITDLGMRDIAKIGSLERLSVRDTNISASGLRALSGMEHLFEIDIGGSKISTEAYYEVLEKLPATGLMR